MLQAYLILLFIGISPLTGLKNSTFCTHHITPKKVGNRCCTGFRGDGVICKPVCPNDCPNGVCTKPYHCECNAGFIKLDDPYTCVPIVTTTSSNGLERNCVERCSNGTCANGICSCAPGWQLEQQDGHDICVPPCSGGCVNGYCSAANTCVCSEGFEPLPHNQYECVRRTVSGAHRTHSAGFIWLLASLLLISCYWAFWRNLNVAIRR